MSYSDIKKHTYFYTKQAVICTKDKSFHKYPHIPSINGSIVYIISFFCYQKNLLCIFEYIFVLQENNFQYILSILLNSCIPYIQKGIFNKYRFVNNNHQGIKKDTNFQTKLILRSKKCINLEHFLHMYYMISDIFHICLCFYSQKNLLRNFGCILLE